MDYYAINGVEIRNKGEVDLGGASEKGTPTKFTTQVGEGVERLLVSVRSAAKGGNMVMFGADLRAIKELAEQITIEENFIVDTRTGVKNKTKNKRRRYVYPMTIRREKRKDPNAMDIGSVGRFESDNQFVNLKRMMTKKKTSAHGQVFEG